MCIYSQYNNILIFYSTAVVTRRGSSVILKSHIIIFFRFDLIFVKEPGVPSKIPLIKRMDISEERAEKVMAKKKRSQQQQLHNSLSEDM